MRNNIEQDNFNNDRNDEPIRNTGRAIRHERSTFSEVFKLFLLLLSLFYLIPMEFIIKLGNIFQRIVAFVFIDPLSYIIFIITKNEDLDIILRYYRRHMIVILSFIIFSITSLLLIHFKYDINFSIPPLFHNHHHHTPTKLDTNPTLKSVYSETIADFLRDTPTDNINNWEKLIEEFKYLWQRLESDGHHLQLQVNRLQSEFYTHQNVFESEQVKVWNELKEKRNKIDLLKQSLQKIIETGTTYEYDKELLQEIFHSMSTGLVIPEISSFIRSAIDKYHQDVLDTADYALKSRKATILYSITSSTYYHVPAWKQSIFRFIGLITDENSPELAISQRSHIGECWSMDGNNGTLGIVLSEPIQIDGITIEYPSANIMSNHMENAPRLIELFGITNYPKRPRQMVSLGLIEYDITKDSSIQTFKITSSSTTIFSAVQVKIHSNWGSLDYTDIYRVRIHGQPRTTKTLNSLKK